MSETDYANLQVREPPPSAKWVSDVKAMAKHERLHPEEYADLYTNEDWK